MAAKKTPISKTARNTVAKKKSDAASKVSQKASVQKASVQKASVKKPAAKKTAVKKLAVKKAASKKATAKTFAVKKRVVKKAPARTSRANTAPAKKAGLKKSAAKKSTAQNNIAKKSTVKKAVVKKTVAKKSKGKAPEKKLSQNSATRKAVARKSVTPKPASQKPASQKGAGQTKEPSRPLVKPIVKAASAPAPRHRAAKAPSSKLASVVKVRPNPVKIVPPPMKLVTLPTGKTPKQAKNIAKPMTGVRGSLRSPTLAKKSARSAARGLAPSASVGTSAADTKPRPPVDQPLSEQKLRENIRTSLRYLEAWLRSGGADVTPELADLSGPAEAARAQIWRWLDRGAVFEDGRPIDTLLFEEILNREMGSLRNDLGTEAFNAGLFVTAAELFLNLAISPDFSDFPGIVPQV